MKKLFLISILFFATLIFSQEAYLQEGNFAENSDVITNKYASFCHIGDYKVMEINTPNNPKSYNLTIANSYDTIKGIKCLCTTSYNFYPDIDNMMQFVSEANWAQDTEGNLWVIFKDRDNHLEYTNDISHDDAYDNMEILSMNASIHTPLKNFTNCILFKHYINGKVAYQYIKKDVGSVATILPSGQNYIQDYQRKSYVPQEITSGQLYTKKEVNATINNATEQIKRKWDVNNNDKVDMGDNIHALKILAGDNK